MPSIAHSPPILETGSQERLHAIPHVVNGNESTQGRYRRARLRLMVAIPVAAAVWVLATGVLGHQILLSLESHLPAATFDISLTILVSGLLLFVGLAVITGMLLARSVLRPIAQIVDQLSALSRSDSFLPLPVTEPHEIGLLSERLNTMLGALQARSMTRSRGIMEQFAGALITTDPEGRVTAMNSAAEQMLGLDESEAQGGEIISLLMHGGRGEAIAREIAWMLRTGEPLERVDTELRRQDGQHLPLVLSGSVQRDTEGSLVGAVINLRDVAMAEAFHEQIRESEQLEALSTFAAGVAHEIRNPLTSIKVMAQLLGEDGGEGGRLRRYAKVVETEVNRLDQIVAELQAFTLVDVGKPERCLLSPLIEQALELARLRLRQRVGGPLPMVCLDLGAIHPLSGRPERLLQALFHVIFNALENSRDRGEVTIRSSDMAETRTVVIEVENTGSVIAPENRERIFMPFFTTKAVGPGLGLAVGRQILQRHRGDITLTAGDDPVVFRITLPRGEDW
ncbi:PAS domain S-box protein [Candidatus Sumerlaeota bacterium]|nr:PAS domain S-box protein [Candidatus Sumerlaeota bacterium]